MSIVEKAISIGMACLISSVSGSVAVAQLPDSPSGFTFAELDRTSSTPIGALRNVASQSSSQSVELPSPVIANESSFANPETAVELTGYPATAPCNCWPYRIPSYDKNIGVKLLDPVNPRTHPFSLNYTGNIEARYFGFAASEDAALDAAGNPQEVRNLNLFQIARWWSQFYGFVGDQNITYSFNIFGSSTQSPAVSLNGAVGYKFSDALTLSLGVDKVPGGREWIESYRWHFGVDRSMATTFFRPAISPGLFAAGNLTDTLSYKAAVVNDGNGAAFNSNRPGENLAYVISPVWEPLGNFGSGFSDLEYHENLVTRIGGVFIQGNNSPVADAVSGNPENTLIRLSDGTTLATTGALGPGVTVQSTDAYLFGFDFSAKMRGASIGFEYFWRVLNDFKTTGGAADRDDILQHGGYLYAGYFIRPRLLELYGRTSVVDGEFGTGYEFGGGVNYFIKGSRKQRAVFEVLHYEDNPADNGITPYRAFFSGTAIQCEYQIVL
ncbi:MAG: hypothetical protein AAGG48_12710 [Planctomycetota bacterium]